MQSSKVAWDLQNVVTITKWRGATAFFVSNRLFCEEIALD